MAVVRASLHVAAPRACRPHSRERPLVVSLRVSQPPRLPRRKRQQVDDAVAVRLSRAGIRTHCCANERETPGVVSAGSARRRLADSTHSTSERTRRSRPPRLASSCLPPARAPLSLSRRFHGAQRVLVTPTTYSPPRTPPRNSSWCFHSSSLRLLLAPVARAPSPGPFRRSFALWPPTRLAPAWSVCASSSLFLSVSPVSFVLILESRHLSLLDWSDYRPSPSQLARRR